MRPKPKWSAIANARTIGVLVALLVLLVVAGDPAVAGPLGGGGGPAIHPNGGSLISIGP